MPMNARLATLFSAFAVLALSGCIFDSKSDVQTDDRRLCERWEPAPLFVAPCDFEVRGDAMELEGGAWTLDTDTLAFSQGDQMRALPGDGVRPIDANDGQSALVLSIDGLELKGGASLRVTGTRPLLFLVWGDVELDR